jgi:restriction system protein
MSWREVDQVLRSLFQRHGFAVSSGARRSMEGVDLVLHRDQRRIFVRCDHWSVWTVGLAPVRRLQELVRRSGADRGIVLTSGEFSPEARDFAQATGLELVDGRMLRDLVQELPQAA